MHTVGDDCGRHCLKLDQTRKAEPKHRGFCPDGSQVDLRKTTEVSPSDIWAISATKTSGERRQPREELA
jgi:hypothetical protein